MIIAAIVISSSVACGAQRRSSVSVPPVSTALSARPATTFAEEKRRYDEQMLVLGEQLSRSLAEIGNRNGGTTAQTGHNLRTAIPTLRAAARKLGAIVPPAPVRAEHQLLRKAILELASELVGPIARLERGDLNGLGAIYSLKGARDMESASANIVKLGYAILPRS